MNSLSIPKGRFIAIVVLASCIAAGRVGAISPQDAANMEAARDVATNENFLVDTNRNFPILFLVGDSTMHNPSKGERSWGDVITKYFNTNQIRVENHALGGRSSRTFITQGWWDKVLDAAKPGDYVIVQLGTNDGGPLADTNRARGSIGGIGDEETNLYNPVMKKMETVHTYGWYLRKYITDARTKGMTIIICSPIPHVPKTVMQPGQVEDWKDIGYAGQVATNENVLYINLNQIVISHYAGMTPQEIKAKYFTPADNTHTSPAGAEVNAASVIEGIQSLTDCPLRNYLVQPETSTNPPAEWIDPDTGHRVVQLSTEPGSESLYFNLNPFTPDGKKMVITTPHGISLIDLQTRAVEQIVKGRVFIIQVGRKTGQIYYIKVEVTNGVTNRVVCATDPATKTTREIFKLSRGVSVSAVNADETLLAGTITYRTDWTNANFDGGPNRLTDIETADQQRDAKGEMMERRLAAHYPNELFTYNLKTGKMKKFDRCTDWLNHLQFSPTDPTLLMFCHEGPWHKVNRIWTIRTDGRHLTLIHQRTMAMEIAGHEFWSSDGKTIWYDLQTPRGEDFWVAGYHVADGSRTWYHLQRNEWSVHFNVSPDGTLFCGDGGDSKMVASAPDGKWLYLFRPELLPNESGKMDTSKLVQPGVFHSEKLVNMSKHDYALEPNLMFSPDMKWLIFRSNMSGHNQVYEVELAKAITDTTATPGSAKSSQ